MKVHKHEIETLNFLKNHNDSKKLAYTTLIDFIETEDKLCLVLDLCQGGAIARWNDKEAKY